MTLLETLHETLAALREAIERLETYPDDDDLLGSLRDSYDAAVAFFKEPFEPPKR